MTTNQMIDGVLVSRALLEKLVGPGMEGSITDDEWDELRALLDSGQRPEGCCCPPKNHSGLWAGAMCPVHFGLRVGKSAAQPQGEPIYQLEYLGEGGGGWNDVDKATYERFERMQNYRPRIVYAEQPAPVAVVMPERLNGGA